MDPKNQSLNKDIHFVLTANRLNDGRVVWFTSQDKWSFFLEDAQIFSSKPALEEAQQQASKDVTSQYIVDLYPVELNADRIPRTTREQIRASGPSVHPEFNPRFV